MSKTLGAFLSVMPYAASDEVLDILAHMATQASCEEGWSESDTRNFDLAATERRAAIEAKQTKARAARGHPHDPASPLNRRADPRRSSRPEKVAGTKIPPQRS